MRRIVPTLVSAALLVLAGGGGAYAAAGPRLDGCRYVSTADAAALLGERTSRVPDTGRDCLYAASSAAPGDLAPGLLVQARRWSGKPTIPTFGTAADVRGARRCWTVQLQGLTLSCYRDGRLLTVTAMSTPDDTATAAAAMDTALARLNRSS